MNPLTRGLCLAGRVLGGESVLDREWDICVVLDGCRLDTYRAVENPNADSLRSVASTSPRWLERTFGGRDNSRLAMVTGNPFADRVDLDGFAYVHHAPVREVEGIETVPPDALADHAIDVWRRRDELGVDRLVVHFMQPHVPFRSRPAWFDRWRETDTWGSSLWEAIGTGDIDRAAFLEAYRDNLRWVLHEGVAALAVNADASIAVTADHGNAVGEWGVYGHPPGAPVASVRRVPWDTIEGRDTGSRSPAASTTTGYDAGRQLSALGYAEGGGV